MIGYPDTCYVCFASAVLRDFAARIDLRTRGVFLVSRCLRFWFYVCFAVGLAARPIRQKSFQEFVTAAGNAEVDCPVLSLMNATESLCKLRQDTSVVREQFSES